jgi:DegV family protein with EDD domain
MPVSVVSDSTHYIPSALVEERGLHVVSLYVTHEGVTRREAEMDLTAFYARLRSADDMPTTSQPSIGDFLEAFRPLLEAGHDIVSVHMSAQLSGTAESARQAAEQLRTTDGARRIEVVDSKTTAGGLAAVVLAAQAAATGGADVDAVVARARRAADEVKIWFALDTLEYLRRGGRVGAAQAWVGGALKIRPILSIDGVIAPIERVRTSSRARERLVDYLRARKEDGATAWFVQHIQSEEQVARLVERGREVFGHDPVLVSEIGPVIGSHAGPGLLGVAGLPPELLR